MDTYILAQSVEDHVIALRRKIHENPEVSEEEFETQALIIEELENLGIPYEKVGITSVVATIEGIKTHSNEKTIAFRADIDALPMQEESGLSFSSKNKGVAHTCGHDAHAAILLGLAKLLVTHRDQFSGKVKLIFQEAEERVCGARKIIDTGILKDVSEIYALHCLNDLKVGTISVTSGNQLSGSDSIKLKWTGVSGHGSQPHLSKDSILAASKFVTCLSDIVVKNVSPIDSAALSVGTFHGGQASNIVSKYCDLGITFRYFNDTVQKAVHKSIYNTAKGIAMMYDLEVDIHIKENVKPLCNHPVATETIKTSYLKLNTQVNIEPYQPLMSSEDFSEYVHTIQGAMLWLGTGNEAIGAIHYPHHEKFIIDESAFKYGVALFMQITLDKLN